MERRIQVGTRRHPVWWTGLVFRLALAFAFALGTTGVRSSVGTEAETLAESDGDAESHKRDEQRVTRHRAARLLGAGGRGVAIFATPRRMAPTVCAPPTRARGVPRRTNPDDDDDERSVG